MTHPIRFCYHNVVLLQRIREIETLLLDFIDQHFQVQLEKLTVETPPQVDFGDLAFPFPFELAKFLRRAPRRIAEEVVEKIQAADGILPPHVERIEAGGAGYVNVFFNRALFFSDLCSWLRAPVTPPNGGKIVVEHTNINPNKAAHIGHLRNAALGDTFVRLLRASSRRVEVHNYIDNTGVQVADVVVGFREVRKLSLDQVKAIEDPFDFYCWDLYAEVSEWYAQDEPRLRHRHQTLAEIEKGEGESSELAEYLSMRIVRAHLETMKRIGVRYDILPRESEILHLKFWEEAFELLQKRQAIQYVEEGPNRGCWVMRLPDESGTKENDKDADEKIIVRSNGTVTYVGKDIAYQLWKFGLLAKDFYYRRFYEYEDGSSTWISTVDSSDQSNTGSHTEPDFGRGVKVYNVIDVRQSYLQRVVVEGLRSLGFKEQADRSVHFAYEMVALSPACCVELGIQLSEEEKKKPFIEVSGRRGLGVKADDLINKLIEKSAQEVDGRQKDLPLEKRIAIANQIAVGALRYFLLKYTRNSVISFDFAEALSFEGETGPYLQYSVVRANNIFRKLKGGISSDNNGKERLWRHRKRINELLGNNEIWGILLLTARIEDIVRQSIETMEISCLAKYAFTLAQRFNLFYHNYHILSEKDSLKKDFYLAVADTTRQGLLRTLDLLGIEVPEKM